MALNVSSYTGLSRHGIYYFRYPWGCSESGVRRSMRLSLQTRCPKEATSLARRLTSYCEELVARGVINLISYTEAHGLVKSFCEENLLRMKTRVDEKSFSKDDLQKLENMIEWLDQDLSGDSDLADDVVTY